MSTRLRLLAVTLTLVVALSTAVVGAQSIQTPAQSQTQPPGASASVTFSDQVSNGTTVTVDSVNLSEGGFVVVHNSSLLDGDPIGSAIGASAYLGPGEHTNVTVTLDRPITSNQTLIAMAHEDSNDNQTYEFVETAGLEDGPYIVDNEPVTDSANVSVVPTGNVTTPVGNETENATTPTENVTTPTENATTPVGNETENVTTPVGNETENVTTPVGNETENVTTPVGNETENVTTPTEETSFQVSNLSAPMQVTQGEGLVVSATITNPNDAESTQVVQYRFNGAVLSRFDLSLNASESKMVTFTVDTSSLAAGESIHGVFTRDRGQIAEVDVVANQSVEADNESFFVLNVVAPQNATLGDTVTATGVVANPNNATVTQEVEFRFLGDVVDRQEVTLDPYEVADVSFSVNSSGLAPGEYYHAVFTRDYGQYEMITLEAPASVPEQPVGNETENATTPTENVTTPTENVTTPVGNETENVTTPTENVTTPTENVTTPVGNETENATTPVGNETENATTPTENATNNETAALVVVDQTVENASLAVQSASLPEGGFVAVYQPPTNASDGNDTVANASEFGEFLGATDYLGPGTSENVSVPLEMPPLDNESVLVVAHMDTNANETFDYVTSNGTVDTAYLADGEPVTGNATVVVRPA